jgi:phosphopantetheinyl transferase
MSTNTLSSALRAQLRGATSTADLTEAQRAALRTWSRRQARAKAQGAKAIAAPTGKLVWL